MRLRKTILLVTVVLLLERSAQACEPILPFIKVVGGPAILLGSWGALLTVVAVKSLIFSLLQKKLQVGQAFLFMIAGNILTTIVGFFVAALMGSGPIVLLGALIVWPFFVLPAKRAIAATSVSWLKKLSAAGLAAVMSMMLVLSCMCFGISYFHEDISHLAAHWIWKLAAVYTALIPSIVLTAFWEEWVVWKLSRCPAEFTGYVKPVVRANLAVLLCVMLYAAAIVLPQRLKSPHFLVRLGLVSSATVELDNASCAGIGQGQNSLAGYLQSSAD